MAFKDATETSSDIISEIPDWPLPELQRLGRVVHGVLNTEAAGDDEPESEEVQGTPADDECLGADRLSDTNEKDALQACLKVLCRSAVTTVSVSPESHEKQSGLTKELPAAMEEIASFTKVLWQLCAVRGCRIRELSKRLTVANAEVCSQRDRASRAEIAQVNAEADVGQGEKANEMLEGTLARLTAARKALKEREWELADVRRRLENSEEERVRQEARARSMETALERSTWTRDEDLRAQLAEAKSDPSNMKDDLQRQLDETRKAKVVQQELEARSAHGQNSSELCAVTPVEKAVADLPTNEQKFVFKPMASRLDQDRSSLGQADQGQHAHVDDIMFTGMARPTPRTGLRHSLCSRGGVDPVATQRQRQSSPASPSATLPESPRGTRSSSTGRLVSPARLERARGLSGQKPARQGRRSFSGPSASDDNPALSMMMPMDLRSLGKLLTGGVGIKK